jgi:flagellar protein FliO/FliZ
MDIDLVPETTQSIETQPYAPSLPETQIQDNFSWAGIISTIIVFIMILSIVFWMIQRLSRKGLQSVDTSWIRVLDRQTLSPQHNLYLVEVAGRIHILGSTDHQISQIATIDDTRQVSEILEEIARRPDDTVDRFMRFVRQDNKEKAVDSSWENSFERNRGSGWGGFRDQFGSNQFKGMKVLKYLNRNISQGFRHKKMRNNFSSELEKLMQDEEKF